ncbi:LysR family transcriptional regulator [Nocardia sp. alder85J]|uniref:LysR family transcriptional regulator n=1 Tax=Nocardia sp. alder85J TaxID=2862949 RepID=UPI001CD4639C|nr:LysR family transcriptional regulator [Nocardia sp. alder85J]MCX4094736.1 LysR family transcriptional regulator [Nocardia sp. alder85J]
MDTKQLTAFLAVADAGGVTRAAEVLHLTQSSVTRQVRALEQELGVTLFDRTPGGMVLTPAGAIMLDRSRRALDELGRARLEIAPVPDSPNETVTVGLLDSVAEVVGVTLFAAVHRDGPGVDLRIITGDARRLHRGTESGHLDVCLTTETSGTLGLRVSFLASEPLWVVAPAAAGLRARSPISLREVVGKPLVMLPRGTALRSSLDRVGFSSSGPRIAATTSSHHVIRQLVAAGVGWTILPLITVAGDLAAGRVSAAPLRDPVVERRIILMSSPAGESRVAVQRIAQLLTGIVHSEIRDGRWPSAYSVGEAVGRP